MHRTLYLQAVSKVYGLKLLAERKRAYSPEGIVSQGSSRLATPGFETESLWDSMGEIMLRLGEWACGAGRFAT
jgi:hypothetical protein